MKNTRSARINQVKYTDKILTASAGLLPFSLFLENSGLLTSSLKTLNFSKKSAKGQSFRSILKQILCFMTVGKSNALSHFDYLGNDPGYAAVLEMYQNQLVSSHTVKRILRSMTSLLRHPDNQGDDHFHPFRNLLELLFRHMLRYRKPESVVISIDSMVLDNDLARKREGCAPTYKKVTGFHPLHAVWDGLFIDAIFRPGNHHSNHKDQVSGMIRRITAVIREELGKDVNILFRMDSGYYDQKLMSCCEELKVKYLISARDSGDHWEQADEVAEDDWKIYDNGHQKWHYCSYSKKLNSWGQVRTFYHLIPAFDKDEKMQQMMSFGRMVSLVVTNLEEADFTRLATEEEKHWQDVLIALHHGRGADELVHRQIKEFGGERMPFKRYEMNGVWYYLRILSSNCHQYFDEGILMKFKEAREYVSTTRRRLFCVAGQIVKKNGRRLDIQRQTGEMMKFREILDLCRKPELLIRI